MACCRLGVGIFAMFAGGVAGVALGDGQHTLQTGLVGQKARDHVMHHLLHRRRVLRLCDTADLPMLMTLAGCRIALAVTSWNGSQ